MKYVHQKDDAATFMVDDEETRTRDVAIEDPLLDYWLSVAGAPGRPELVVDEMPDGVWFDPGGMVTSDEPKVWVDVRGQRFGSWLRGLDGLVEALRRPGTWAHDENGPPHCFVRGRWLSIILTLETAKMAADLFEAEYERREDEADEQEHRIVMARLQTGVLDGRMFRREDS